MARSKVTKRILAYGDSNTWGFLSLDDRAPQLERLPFEDRWTGQAQAKLGCGFAILEDALPGRTLGLDRPDMAGSNFLKPSSWNGLKELPVALIRNVPIGLVVVGLGTNDLLQDRELEIDTYLDRVNSIVNAIRSFQLPLPLKGMPQSPAVLVMAPPSFGGAGESPATERAEAKRVKLLPELIKHARDQSYHLVNAAQGVPTLAGDGVHLDRQAHQRLGLHMAGAINAIYSTTGHVKWNAY
jgi:lysophospholipase L1-like esterase